MRPILLYLFLIVNTPQALAHDSHDQPLEYRSLKQVDVSESIKAHVIVRDDGHVLGQPFQVELRVQCEQGDVDMKELIVRDSFSVCDLDPQSVKVNLKKDAVALKTKMADVNHYYDNLDKKLKKVPCLKETKIKKFSLKNLCSETSQH